MKNTLLIPVVAALLVTGCSDRTHDFTLRFRDVHGLAKGDPVYLEESVIGTVDEVTYTDQGLFLVQVSIHREFESAATQASRFFIDTRPDTHQKIIRVVQLTPGGEPIAEGSVVDGQTRFAVLYEQLARQVGEKVADLESGINGFLKELKAIPEKEQIKQLERELDRILADLGRMSREMEQTLEKDVLPKIEKKIEELRKKLERTGDPHDLEVLEEKLDRIHDKLQV